MSALPKNASPNDSRATHFAAHDGNQRLELAAQADLLLADYPTDVREQIIELICLLASKPGPQKTEFGSSHPFAIAAEV
jgi:hypothetical protein